VFCCTWLLLLVAPAAALARAAVPTDLEYAADPACPDRERFVAAMDEHAQVLGRDLSAPWSSSSPRPRIRVDIRIDGGGFRGSLERRDKGGASSPRELVSADCAEVASALALTAVLSHAPAVTVAARPPPPPGAPATAATAAPAMAHPAEWLLGLAGHGSNGVSPYYMTGVEVSAGGSRRWGAGATWWSARLGAAYARNDWVEGDRAARFALLSARLELCPLGGPLGARLEVGVCGTGEAGWLRGRGVNVAHPRQVDVPWLALGGGVLARGRLTGRWQLEARAAAAHPLRRINFRFDTPDRSVADVRAVSFTVAVGLVARFQ
jgi:hypothetical protein